MKEIGLIKGEEILLNEPDYTNAWKFSKQLPDPSTTKEQVLVTEGNKDGLGKGTVVINKNGEKWVTPDNSSVPCGTCYDITMRRINFNVTLRWRDPEPVAGSIVKWAYTKVVRKYGSSPTGPDDGFCVVQNARKDWYYTHPLVDRLPPAYDHEENPKEWYYAFYAFSDDGTCVIEEGYPAPEFRWEDASEIISKGLAPKMFKLGDTIEDPSLKGVVWMVVGFDCCKLADPSKKHSMLLANVYLSDSVKSYDFAGSDYQKVPTGTVVTSMLRSTFLSLNKVLDYEDTPDDYSDFYPSYIFLDSNATDPVKEIDEWTIALKHGAFIKHREELTEDDFNTVNKEPGYEVQDTDNFYKYVPRGDGVFGNPRWATCSLRNLWLKNFQTNVYPYSDLSLNFEASEWNRRWLWDVQHPFFKSQVDVINASIDPRSIATRPTIEYTQDRVWIASLSELYGIAYHGLMENEQIPYFKEVGMTCEADKVSDGNVPVFQNMGKEEGQKSIFTRTPYDTTSISIVKTEKITEVDNAGTETVRFERIIGGNVAAFHDEKDKATYVILTALG